MRQMDPLDYGLGWDDVQRMKMGLFVAVCWFIAAFLPPMLFDRERVPRELWVIFGLFYAYMGYSGIRALRKGWRSRFVLRVVVPLSIFSASFVLSALGVWRFPN